MNGSKLIIHDLTKSFGGLLAVDHVNITTIPRGITGIIGPNGAGKTTVFNLISGFYKPSRGQILLDDQELTGKQPHYIASLGIGRTFQNIRLFQGMMVIDNVLTALHNKLNYNLLDSLLYLPKVKKEEKKAIENIMILLGKLDLIRYANALAISLPYGTKRRLEMARALVMNPKILLLDEPAAGLNPSEIEDLSSSIQKINQEFKITILLIEHRMDLVASLCEKVYVMNFGKVIACGTFNEVQGNPLVLEAYLGKGASYAQNI